MILASQTGALILQALVWLIFIIPIVFIIIVLRKENINNKSKIFWTIMLLFLNYIGLIIYLLVPNKNILK